jgi:ATP-dependent Clp protease ATP-binding subunit ClpA
MNKRKHRGTDLRDFLAEEGMLEEVEARALKRALALQLATLIEQKSLSKGDMALRGMTFQFMPDIF